MFHPKGWIGARALRAMNIVNMLALLREDFPISEDYGGLTISPSNTLIYSGSVDDDWVNGMLAWRIISED